MPQLPSGFTDLLLAQDPAVFGNQFEFVVNAQFRDPGAFGAIVRGRNARNLIQHGTSAQFFHLNASGQTLKPYTPGQPEAPNALNVMSKVEFNWRWLRDTSFTYQEELLDLNGPMNSDWKTMQFKDWLTAMRTAWNARGVNGLELAMTKPPNRATMEGPPGAGQDGEPFCLWALVNEFPNGLIPALIDAGGLAWTTVATKDPTAFPDWVPTRSPYSNVTLNQPGNIIEALNSAADNAQWNQEGFRTDPQGDTWAPNIRESSKEDEYAFAHWLLSQFGMTIMRRLYDSGKCFWVNPLDPWHRMYFRGAPFVTCDSFTSAKVFPTGAGGAAGLETEQTAGVGGPRIVGISNKHLMPVWKTGWVNKVEKPIQIPFNSGGYYVPRKMCLNLCTDARKYLSIVFPTANIAA